MIPVNRPGLFDVALEVLQRYGDETSARGRFILLYLGLRRMGNMMAALGDNWTTSASDIEQFLDRLFSKTHRPEPLVVLTSAFGQSTSPHAPWSSRTDVIAPGNRYPTNTWRNNLNVQKGIGCPADPDVIRTLLANPLIRLSCPFMNVDSQGHQQCTIIGTQYRGDEHSIWLRMAQDGYQAVDLNTPSTYSAYISPKGRKIPLFALIAVLYCNAPVGIYPNRQVVGVPEFAQDFLLTIDQTLDMFDADPNSPANAEIIVNITGGAIAPPLSPPPTVQPPVTPTQQPLPPTPEPITMNTGVGAELVVARDLERYHWSVSYTGNIRGLGHDLLATQTGNTIRIEVKSSISLCTPELTDEEWRAAQRHGDQYVLAIVDFYGSPGQRISYVRNPAANLVPSPQQTTMYRVARQDIVTLGVGAEFL